MKTNLLEMKRVLSATLLVLLLSVVGMTKAFAFTVDNLNYSVNSDGTTVTVTGHASGTAYYGSVIIPDEVTYQETNYTVTKIAASAFQNCVGITSVTIPSSMTNIGDEAFAGCSGLITLNYNAINCSLVSHDYSGNYYAYHWLYGCASLVSLNIGDGVQRIPNYFVCGRSGGDTSSGGYHLTGTIIIPNSVISVGYKAFYECRNIGSVRIGNSVTNIGEYAFYYCSNMGSLTIGTSVSSIGQSAFGNCSKLTSVVLPSSMTTISNYLFDGCYLLSSVTIPNTIVSIGEYAFRNCNLASLNIPNSVVSIGASAFAGNSSLTSVTYGENLVSIGESAFYNCSNITSLNIPNSVVSIGNSAFYGCSRLSNLNIGDGVASIGNSAFYNCSALTYVTLGNSLTSIGGTAFYGCTNLPSFNIPVSVSSIGVDVFGNCTKLGHIAVDPENTLYDSRNNCNAIIETASNKLVAGCKNTVIPNTVTVIGNRAFYSCTVLTGTLSIPNSVTTIEEYAFYGCSSLSGHLNLPNSVVTLGASAFQNCVGITSVTIPSSMTNIGDEAFAGCSGLITLNYNAINCSLVSHDYSGNYYAYHWLYGCASLVSLNIGDGVQRIPNYFVCGRSGGDTSSGGYHLTGTIIIPNSVISVGYKAFYECRNIGSVRIGNSVTNIGEYAFYYCSNMGSLTIGTSVSSIGQSAFGNCSKLTSVVLPSSMTTISNYLFDGCYLLSSVTIPNTIVSIGEYAFRNCNLASLNIPNSVVSIGASAFAGNSSLTSVTYGESVGYVGASAFYNCSNMTSMKLRPSNPPGVMSNAFYNVPKSIPVELPCNTLSDYQAASGWSSFTNMYENCNTTYEIVTTANPAAGGIVTGGGTYNQNASCTLNATANLGYEFVSWTEGEIIVSTDATYSFSVGGDRNLVANFAFTGSYANHWIPSSSNYADNMAIYAVIQIDGEEQATDQYEVGAFCNNECRGSAIASLFAITNRYLIVMMVYGEGGDEFRFRLYDHSIGQELNYSIPTTVAFNVDGYGTPIEPYVLNFLTPVEITAVVNPYGAGTVSGTGLYAPGATCNLIATPNTGYQFKNWTLNDAVVSTLASYSFEVTEAAEYVANFNYVDTHSLTAGWNWYSTCIEQDGIDGLTMLENSLGSSGIRIQGRNGMVDYYEYQGNYGWYGSLSSITNEQMYKIRTNAICNAVISGDMVVTENHPITINNGWNWIGFPCSHSVSVTIAMSGFTATNNDVIKGRNSVTTYLADGNTWYGTLNTLEPGHGYMYKSNSSSAKTLTFNTYGKDDAIANITPKDNIFTPEDAEFESNMLVMAVININGVELHSDDYELVAFVDNECRGSVKLMYIEPLDRYLAFLLVYGDANENIVFALTDGTETLWSDDMMVYSSDAIVGNLSDPATIQFGALGLDDNEVARADVYPNPTQGVFNVKSQGIRKIEVVNVYGQIVMSKDVYADNMQVDLGENSPGTYLLRLFTDNGIVVKNLFKNN